MQESCSSSIISNQANPQDESDQKHPIIQIITTSLTKIEDDIYFSSSDNYNEKDISPTEENEPPFEKKCPHKSFNQPNVEQGNLNRAKSQYGFFQEEENEAQHEKNTPLKQEQGSLNIEMQPIKMDYLAIPQQYRNIESYQQIYKTKSSLRLSQYKEPLQTIEEDPSGSVSESCLDRFSLDQYDYREQAIPSDRPSSESYQLRKPKTSIVQGSGYAFHVEDILEVSEDSILIKVNEEQTEKVQITNKLTHDINKINRYYKKPAIFKPLYQDMNINHAWILLLIGTFVNGIIPSWIQYIPAEKYLRLAWRFFMQFFMMIPFALYERRTGDEKIKAKYSFSYILKSDNLKKIFLSSFTMCTWFAFTLFCFEWTYVSHAIILGNLVNFYLFIQRIISKAQVHFIEIFGGIIVFLGVSCVLSDNIFFDPSDLPPSAYTYKMKKFIYRENWQRVLFGNGSSLIVSFLMSKLAKHQSAAREVFPPHLNTLLTFFLNMFNLTLISYFLSGMDFIKDPAWGWYGLFTTENFISFFIMTFLLGMGSFVTTNLINRIFEPLVPQTTQLFEPVISTLSLQVLGVQILPNGLTCLGYALILPGLFSIILGQFFIQQYKKNKS